MNDCQNNMVLTEIKRPNVGTLYRLHSPDGGLWLFHREPQGGWPGANSNDITLGLYKRTKIAKGCIVMIIDWHINEKLSTETHTELVVSLLIKDKVLCDVGFKLEYFFGYFERVS